MASASAPVDVDQVVVVLTDGSNIINYRSEVELRAFNSSGEIVHQAFKVHVEGENSDVIACIASVKMAEGKNSDVIAGIATVTTICVINTNPHSLDYERTPTNDDYDENGADNATSVSGKLR